MRYNSILVAVAEVEVKRHKRTKLSQVDLRALLFLWKWKIATTAALHAKFYAPRSLKGAYLRLNVLENDGFVHSHFDVTGEKFLWSLTATGFLAIRSQLPPLKEEGFLSEAPGHDLLSMAAMCGDWLTVPQSGVHLISEQQIRRYQNPFSALEESSKAYQKLGSLWLSNTGDRFIDTGQMAFGVLSPKMRRPILWRWKSSFLPKAMRAITALGNSTIAFPALSRLFGSFPPLVRLRKILSGLSVDGDVGTERTSS